MAVAARRARRERPDLLRGGLGPEAWREGRRTPGDAPAPPGRHAAPERRRDGPATPRLNAFLTRWGPAPSLRAACPHLVFASRPWDLRSSHFGWARAVSIACVTFADSGSSSGSNRAITSPLRLTRNLAKFQEIAPANLGLVSGLVRNW